MKWLSHLAWRKVSGAACSSGGKVETADPLEKCTDDIDKEADEDEETDADSGEDTDADDDADTAAETNRRHRRRQQR